MCLKTWYRYSKLIEEDEKTTDIVKNVDNFTLPDDFYLFQSSNSNSESEDSDPDGDGDD